MEREWAERLRGREKGREGGRDARKRETRERGESEREGGERGVHQAYELFSIFFRATRGEESQMERKGKRDGVDLMRDTNRIHDTKLNEPN